MKKVYVLLIGITLFAMLLSACGQSQNDDAAPTYKVKQDTGLYSALAIDAEQIAVLPAGAVLVPADSETALLCDTFVNEGLKYALCRVKVFDTGQTGWVLQMFIEKNK